MNRLYRADKILLLSQFLCDNDIRDVNASNYKVLAEAMGIQNVYIKNERKRYFHQEKLYALFRYSKQRLIRKKVPVNGKNIGMDLFQKFCNPANLDFTNGSESENESNGSAENSSLQLNESVLDTNTSATKENENRNTHQKENFLEQTVETSHQISLSPNNLIFEPSNELEQPQNANQLETMDDGSFDEDLMPLVRVDSILAHSTAENSIIHDGSMEYPEETDTIQNESRISDFQQLNDGSSNVFSPPNVGNSGRVEPATIESDLPGAILDSLEDSTTDLEDDASMATMLQPNSENINLALVNQTVELLEDSKSADHSESEVNTIIPTRPTRKREMPKKFDGFLIKKKK